MTCYMGLLTRFLHLFHLFHTFHTFHTFYDTNTHQRAGADESGAGEDHGGRHESGNT